jgi:hypothetical protein
LDQQAGNPGRICGEHGVHGGHSEAHMPQSEGGSKANPLKGNTQILTFTALAYFAPL